MRIGFLVERPTQFEAPFFRYAANDAEHRLEVFFSGASAGSSVHDPELEREVAWGFDLLEGYSHRSLPSEHRTHWLADILERERFDLLIINGYTQRAYLQGLLAAKRARVATALRLDSIAPFRGEERRARDLARRLLYGFVLRPAFDLFLGVGSLTLDFLRQAGIPAERTGLFPYSIDVDDFRRRSRLPPEERRGLRRQLLGPESEPGAPMVLSLAKFGEREAPWDLLRAFAQSAGRSSLGAEGGAASSVRPWLILAGDGPIRPHLEAFAHDRGLDRVRFPGYIPYLELPALYAACDLFVHPAREERWGVSVAEALACGLPVVTSSRVGAAYDLIHPGANGFTYEAGDATDLAQRIDQALSLPRTGVEAESAAILARWDYAATWRAIVEAAGRTLQRR